jgi:hypothetical protein
VEKQEVKPALLLHRREFLKASTGMLTGIVAAGSPLALIAPSRSWAVDLTTLSSAEGATLMAMARTIAPHDKLEDAAYALVIQGVDSQAAKDPDLAKLLKEGVQGLGPEFARAPEEARVAALKKVESSGFFQTMRVKTLQLLYASPLAYAYFGFEGEAFSKGGYLYRGFNDLRWLPDVPAEDAGPVPVS